MACRPLASLVLLCVIAASGGLFAQLPDADATQLKVLEHYVGTWDVQLLTPNGGFEKGESTSRWVLGGKFVEQTSFLEARDGQRLEVKTLYTYDPNVQRFRSWTFTSTGHTTEAEATWDAAKQVMTSIVKPDRNGMRSKIVADFSQKDVEQWTIVLENAAGETVGELRGENRRRATP